MEPNEWETEAAKAWYAGTYPNANRFADEDGPQSEWGTTRDSCISAFISGMRAERERREKIMRPAQQLADAIRKGQQ